MTTPTGGRFSSVASITAVGTYGPFQFQQPKRLGLQLHIEGSSFNLQVLGTLFFNHTTQVGSFYRPITSNITSAGIYTLPEAIPAACWVQVNSIASGDRLLVAMG